MFKTEVFDNKSALIARLTELAESGNWVFRGYSKQDQLQPNIIRRNLVDQERDLLFEFERSANQYDGRQGGTVQRSGDSGANFEMQRPETDQGPGPQGAEV